MRLLLLALALLLTTPAFAQGWDHYSNARFGYGIDIPPGFTAMGEASNGDGQAFDGGAAELLVWGGTMLGDLESEVAQRMEWAEDDAWNIAHQTVTPGWASYGAVKGSRMLHERLVLLCDRESYAAFRLDYSVVGAADMRPVIERLERSLRGESC